MDETKEILNNILKKIKNKFNETDCNKTAVGFLDSYNIVKQELLKINPDIKIGEISKKEK